MRETDQAFINEYLGQSVSTLQTYADDLVQLDLLQKIANAITQSMRADGKLLLAGNGGSAGDAQHIAAEFTGRMLYNRPPLPAIALTTDTSALTAIGNDYGYEKTFERQVIAIGRRGDVFIGMSTSGESANVICALETAHDRGLTTIGFTGAGGGTMATLCDLMLRAPSSWTPVIQQIHMVAAHIICSLVERAMYPQV